MTHPPGSGRQMSTVLFHESPPPQEVAHQVLQLVITNLTDLSLQAVPPSNPLYELFSWTLPCEVDQYLQRIGQMPKGPVELIVAYDDVNLGEVVGFLLYLPVPTHPEACGITYMAVKHSHRRCGLGTSMMREVIARYPHVELTCAVKKVPFYEQMGFQVIDSHHTQVVMNTRSESTQGEMVIVSPEAISQSPQARQIIAKLVGRLGLKVMANAEKQLLRQTDQLARQAESYVRTRLTGH